LFVIASGAKQSRRLVKQAFLDCHVASLLAMTALGKYFNSPLAFAVLSPIYNNTKN